MKIAELTTGQEVAIRGRRAVVLCASIWTCDRGEYRPGRSYMGVCGVPVAVQDLKGNWSPELVQPVRITSTWQQHMAQRDAAEAARREEAALHAARRARRDAVRPTITDALNALGLADWQHVEHSEHSLERITIKSAEAWEMLAEALQMLVAARACTSNV